MITHLHSLHSEDTQQPFTIILLVSLSRDEVAPLVGVGVGWRHQPLC